MRKLIMMVAIVFTGCAYNVKAPIAPLSFIETYKLDTTKIRFDGLYTKIEDTVIYRNSHKDNSPRRELNYIRIFSKKKNLYSSAGKINEYSPLTCEFYKSENKRFSKYEIKFPKYSIKNDSIYTYDAILITVATGQRVPVLCNFRGFVKNRDTITDWKIIPPYPKDFTKAAKGWNKELFESHTLYFVKTDAVKCLQMD